MKGYLKFSAFMSLLAIVAVLISMLIGKQKDK